MLFKDFIENRLKKRNLPKKTAEYAGDVSYITPEFSYTEPEEPEEPQPEQSHSFKAVLAARGKEIKTKLKIKDKTTKK